MISLKFSSVTEESLKNYQLVDSEDSRVVDYLTNKKPGYDFVSWVDVNGNIQPSKLNSRLKRIDGTVATIIAYVTLTRYKLDYESVVK